MDAFVYILLGSAVVLGLAIARMRYASFHGQTPLDYEDARPLLNLREHLSGPILCEGVIYGPTGRVSARFVADFEAQWDGNTGVMKEHFKYDDGTSQHREWRLTLGNDGAVRAEADDVVGGGHGVQKGSALQLKYKIRLPESSGGHVLNTVDWMYLTPNGTIMNRSQFRKYGIKVAELVATMRKKEIA